MRALRSGAVVLAVAALLMAPATVATAAPDAAASCSALLALDLERLPEAPTRITAAEHVAAGPEAPAHCLVTGSVAPQVGFELRLPDPAGWNGNFLFGGCGGLCGGIDSESCTEGMSRGFASATTDTGHRSGSAADALWAYQNDQGVTDWAHRGTHVATVATKKITESFYQRSVGTSYFVGCSNGGRQALMEAQRYPDDFDGIYAGDPGLDYRTVTLNWVWAANANRGPDGQSIIVAADVPVIHDEVLAQCDGLDGKVDRVIDDPRTCTVDAAALACPKAGPCLDDRKLDALRTVYRTPSNAKGEELTPGGLPPGSEGNWVDWVTGTVTAPPLGRVMGDGMLRYLAFGEPPGPGYDPRTFDFDADLAKMAHRDELVSARDTDLSAFRAGGGKLLMTHDWADGVLSPEASLKYYDRVASGAGGAAATQDFARLFMIPGKNHCEGLADPLRILVDWVEGGRAPATIDVDYAGVRRSIPMHTPGAV